MCADALHHVAQGRAELLTAALTILDGHASGGDVLVEVAERRHQLVALRA